EQLGDDIAANRGPQFAEPLGDLPPRQVGPLHVGPHRVACGVVLEHLVEVGLDRRVDLDQGLAATPFFRVRPVSRSSPLSNSASPTRMVLGSQPKTRAIYSVPPCPSLRTSIAAYRRRSFSFKESKRRFIFPSTSAVKVFMSPLPDGRVRSEGQLSYTNQSREVTPGLFLRSL